MSYVGYYTPREEVPRSLSVLFVADRRSPCSAGHTRAECGLQPLLADVAWSGGHRHLDDRQPAARVERDEERALEGRDPRRGHSSPIVWGDRVYLTTAVPVGVTGAAQHAPRGTLAQRGVHKFVVMALDRKTGKTVWERVVREAEPHERSHADNGTWASSSPFTDGQRLYAYFESFGLYAFDMNGTLLWEKDLGDKRMRNEFGEGSTPALHGNTIVVVWDHLNGESFIAALDKRDGKELWRQPRKEIDTWATPLILDVNGRPQAIVPAMERVRSYDLATGERRLGEQGLTMNAIPSPVHEDGLVILMSGFRGNDLKAIRVADAKGNIDGTSAIVWGFDRDTPYVPSPILVDGVLYFLKSNSGILSAFDAKTGKPHYQNQRLESVPNVFSSPVAAQRPRLRHRAGRVDHRHQVGAGLRGPGHQPPRRRLRRLAGAGRQRDVHAWPQVPLRHRRTVRSAGRVRPARRHRPDGEPVQEQQVEPQVGRVGRWVAAK